MAKPPKQQLLIRKPERDNFHTFKNYAIDSWTEEHGTRILWGAPEFRCLKAAYLRVGDNERAMTAWSNFLDCTEPWLRDHNPKTFLARLALWVPGDK